MIVRDEARCLERCLASARPWVDEMLVLDTGSVDATVAIAQRAGARVERSTGATTSPPPATPRWRTATPPGSSCSMPTSGSSKAAARCRRCARMRPTTSARCASSGLRRRRRAASPRRRAGCRACCRAACAMSGASTSSPTSSLPRRPPAVVVGHDGYRDARRRPRPGATSACSRLALAGSAGRRLSSLPARQGPGAEGPLRRGGAALRARAGARATRVAGWRHDLVLRALFTLKRLGRFEAAIALAAGRDAALAALARLLLHARRSVPRLGRGRADARQPSCCR